MPDAHGNFKGISLSGIDAEAWVRIFGSNVMTMVSKMAPESFEPHAEPPSEARKGPSETF